MNGPRWDGNTRGSGGSIGPTGATGSQGATGYTGPALSNWSPYPATTDVNMSNFNIVNAPGLANTGGTVTIAGSNISNTAVNRINLTADRGVDVLGNAEINLLAQNGNHGVVSLTANGGFNNGINGQVDITANGSTLGAFAQGGLINITANTPVSSNYTFTSAIKMGASSILSYAGSFSSYLSLAGYNYTWGQLGVNITCTPTPPSIAIPNTAGTVFISGFAGTKISNELYVDAIKNYNGQDLTISSPVFSGSNANISVVSGKALYLTATTGTAGVINMNGNTTNIQGNAGGVNITGTTTVNGTLNMTGNTISNAPAITSAGNIVLTPASGSNTQINSRLDMNGNNIGTVGNIYFSLADTIASTSSNFIVSTHSNQTYNVGGDFTVNASNMVVNAPLNLTGHDLSNVFNIYSPSNLIAITTGAGNNLSLTSGSNLTLTGTNINLNGALTFGGNLNMSNYNISNVSNISSSSNLTLTGSNIYLNTNVIMNGPSSNYFSFAGKTIYGLKDVYADSNLNLYAGAGYNINLTGVNVSVNGNLLMNTCNIQQLNYISNTTCGFNVNTASGYNVSLNAGGGLYLTAGSGQVITASSTLAMGSNTIAGTGQLLGFSSISNPLGTGTITGYSIAGGGGTASGFSIISNSPSITIITPSLNIQAATNFSNNAISNVSNISGSNIILNSTYLGVTTVGDMTLDVGGVFYGSTQEGATLICPNPNGDSNYARLNPTGASTIIDNGLTGIELTNSNVDAFSLKMYTNGVITQTAGSNSIVIPSGASTTLVATGGAITDVGTRRFHTFTSNDTFIVSANPDGIDIEIFAVGGGGGGGSVSAGGGGGGNVVIVSYTPSAGSNSIYIGAGAAGGTYGSGVPASQGGSTTVSGILTALGGGTGGVYLLNAGGTGGCGGGGSELAYTAYGVATLGTVSAGTTISNIAFNGGTGANNGSAGGAGGGGGGGVGQNTPSNSPVGGNGGDGFLYYGSYYAGGGGGNAGGAFWGTPVVGMGGLGGGGNGGFDSTAGTAGTANTGGGGGGSGYSGSGIQGGTGGSGVVIISYPISSPNIVITDANGIDLDGPVYVDSDLTTRRSVTVGDVLFAPQIGTDVDMLSHTISNASSYIANSSYSNQVSFPFYSYQYSTNLAIGTNFNPVVVFGSTYNWYFDVTAASPYVPSQDGAYDISIQVVLPVERSDGSNGPYPNLSDGTRYTLTASTYSNYTFPFAYWQGTIGNIRDQCGEEQSGSNSFFNINATQLNCYLPSNSQTYFQICFQNVVGSNFPNNGNFTYYARRMV